MKYLFTHQEHKELNITNIQTILMEELILNLKT